MIPNTTETDVFENRELGIQDLLDLIRSSWLPGILGFLVLGGIVGGVSFLLQPKYTAEVLLEYVGDPTKQERVRSSAGGLGGLAALAGVSLGSDGNPKDAALALLRSWNFAEEFIVNNDLMPILNSDEWDAARNQWQDLENTPSLWRTVRRFRRDNLYVSDDAKTGLVTVVITWEDPEAAARWATGIVSAINFRLRDATIAETDRSIEHLKAQLETSQNAELQRAIAGLLQAQIEALMFADIRDEFAFRTIDAAQVPPRDEYVFPNHYLFVFLGGLAGALIAVVFSLVRRTSTAGPGP